MTTLLPVPEDEVLWVVERDADAQLWSEGGGGATLDDLVSGAWKDLAAAAATALPRRAIEGDAATNAVAAACPVCEGELVPRWSAGAGVVGGRCRDCGSELS